MSDTVPQSRQKSWAPRSHQRKRAKEQEDERGEKEAPVEHDYERTPKEPRSKRARTNGKGKEKDSELELGELPNDSSRPFEIGDEFIPFAVSDNEAEVPKTQDSHRNNVEIIKEKPREREWDKGKREMHGDGSRDGGSRGTKRTYEMIFDDEDLRDYRQRRQDFPTSRKAPWVAKVDWDSCLNVAEMYALYFSFTF
jgi:non-canonical poly(A) RNA polymerase PAPD5/7